MKKFVLSAILLVLFCSSGYSASWENGEKLQFEASLLGFTAGEAILTTQKSGTDKYAFSAVVRTASGFTLYSVEQDIRSVARAKDLEPLVMEINAKQGEKRRKRKFTYQSGRGELVVDGTARPLAKGARDYLSGLYLIRRTPLRLGVPRVIVVQSHKKTYRAVLTPLMRETIAVPAGRFDTLKVQLRMTTPNEPPVEGFVWITADADQRPVQIGGELPIGSLLIKLKSYR